MKSHPAAELFPLMEGADLEGLASDIRAHGLLQPIVRLDGLVLDGRNRLRACELAGVEPRFVDWDQNGVAPAEWVISANLHRRHLTQSQRAAIAAEARVLFEAEAREAITRGERQDPVANLRQGSARTYDTTQRAGELLGVSSRSVTYATEVKREDPAAFEQIKTGTKTVNAAVQELRSSLPAQSPAAPKNNREALIMNASVKRMHSLLAGLEGYRRGMEDNDLGRAISAATQDDLAHWERTADEFIRSLRRLRNALREARSHGE